MTWETIALYGLVVVYTWVWYRVGRWVERKEVERKDPGRRLYPVFLVGVFLVGVSLLFGALLGASPEKQDPHKHAHKMAVGAINLLLERTQTLMNRERELTGEIERLKARVAKLEKITRP